MAEGLAREFGWQAYSAGVNPSKQVNPYAVAVMQEKGLNIAEQLPKDLDSFICMDIDYIVTLCDHANEVCPVFTGSYKKLFHHGFPDPYGATGTDEEILDVYRKTRDDISDWLKRFTEEMGVLNPS